MNDCTYTTILCLKKFCVETLYTQIDAHLVRYILGFVQYESLTDETIHDAVHSYCNALEIDGCLIEGLKYAWSVGTKKVRFRFGPYIGHWDVSKVTNMHKLFSAQTKFNEDLSGWDVSNVVDMSCMFADASIFNGNIGNWNVGQVEDMHCMFYYAHNFNADISRWDTRNVKNMAYMFWHATNFNVDVRQWNVKSAEVFNFVFKYANNYQGGNPQWIVQKHKDFRKVFGNYRIAWWRVARSLQEYQEMEQRANKWRRQIERIRRKDGELQIY